MKLIKEQKLNRNKVLANFYYETYKDKNFGSIKQIRDFVSKLPIDLTVQNEVVYLLVNKFNSEDRISAKGRHIETFDAEKVRARAKSRIKDKYQRLGIESTNSKIKRWTEE